MMGAPDGVTFSGVENAESTPFALARTRIVYSVPMLSPSIKAKSVCTV